MRSVLGVMFKDSVSTNIMHSAFETFSFPQITKLSKNKFFKKQNLCTTGMDY
jgi:hypothetical protein